MTWFASHVYFRPTDAVLARFRQDDVFARGLYVVDSLPPEVLVPGVEGIGLPPSGLGVVRELAAKSDDDPAWDWFGPRAVDWSPFEARAASLPLPSSDVAFEGREDEGYPDTVPPAALLTTLKGIALETDTPVAYYSHFTWGGSTELEVAWMFGAHEWLALHRDDDHCTQIVDGVRRDQPANVLELVMRAFGVEASGRWFALHTRKFPWARFRIAP